MLDTTRPVSQGATSQTRVHALDPAEVSAILMLSPSTTSTKPEATRLQILCEMRCP